MRCLLPLKGFFPSRIGHLEWQRLHQVWAEPGPCSQHGLAPPAKAGSGLCIGQQLVVPGAVLAPQARMAPWDSRTAGSRFLLLPEWSRALSLGCTQRGLGPLELEVPGRCERRPEPRMQR